MLRRAAALLLQLSALRPAAAVFVSEQCFPWSCIEMCKADANCDGIVYVANQNGCTFRASMKECESDRKEAVFTGCTWTQQWYELAGHEKVEICRPWTYESGRLKLHS